MDFSKWDVGMSMKMNSISPIGWKVEMQRDLKSGDYRMHAEITRDHLDLLKEKARILSEQIMMNEESIVLDTMSDAAILRMRDLIHAQIVSRGLV